MRPKTKKALALGIASIIVASTLTIIWALGGEDSAESPLMGPINIDDEEALLASGMVLRGAGSPSDPYVIENLHIAEEDGGGLRIANISADLVIRNITLAGSYDSLGYGIHLRDCSNVRILDSTFSGWIAGVLIGEYGGPGCADVEIRGCTFTRCEFGVAAHWSDKVTVERNEFRDSTSYSCYLGECQSVRVGENIVLEMSGQYTAHSGITLCNVTDGEVLENRIRAITTNSLALEHCENITVSSNDVSGAYLDCILIVNCEGIDLTGNTVSRAWYDSYENYGVHLSSSTDCVVKDNLVTRGSMYFIDVNRSIIEGNEVRDARGICLDNLSDSSVTGNCAVNNTRDFSSGISLSNCGNLTVSDNFVSGDNYGGMMLIGSEDVRVISNTITDNMISTNVYGGQLMISRCRDCAISENVISSSSYGLPGYICVLSTNMDTSCNRFAGVDLTLFDLEGMRFTNNSLDGECTLNLGGLEGGEMHDNNLMDVHAATASSTILTMDAGYPSGGNYWENYPGEDLFSGPDQDIPGADGIGDDPVMIDSETLDRYPLMSRVQWEDATAPSIYSKLTGTCGLGGWFVSTVSVEITAAGLLDVPLVVEYRLDSEDWTQYVGNITIGSTGTHTLEYRSSGNGYESEGTGSVAIMIDRGGPAFHDVPSETAHYEANPVSLDLDVSDEGSGLWIFMARLEPDSGRIVEYEGIDLTNLTLTEGSLYETYISAMDIAGNVEQLEVVLTLMVDARDEALDVFLPFETGFILGALAATALGVCALGLLVTVHRDRLWTSVLEEEPESETEGPERRDGP